MRGMPRRFVRRGKEPFRERERTEEERCVDGVAGEGVAEEGQTCDVTGGEAGGGVRVGAEELPGGKVGDEEELERAEKYGATNAENAAPIRKTCADEHADQEAGVNDRNETMETDEEISCEEGHERKKKRHAAIAKHRAGEDRHGADGREVPRMRKDAHHGGEDDHYGDENGAKHENVSGRFFLKHDLNQASF